MCGGCNRDISKVQSNQIIKGQVFDLPPMNIKVTEYQSHKVCCPHCQKVNQETFPPHIKGVTQYGNKLKSFVSYLNAHHMLPYERITELIEDMISHKISTGSIYNFLSESYDNLEVFEEELKKRLLQEKVLHADETGINVQGKLKWIHTATCETAVHYGIHNKRGQEAIDAIGILPKYQGILIHDHWTPYNKSHSYCNAHILRELQAEIDKNDKLWAKELQTLLKESNKTVNSHKEEGKASLSKEISDKIKKKYEKITTEALDSYPPPKNQKNEEDPNKKKVKTYLIG